MLACCVCISGQGFLVHALLKTVVVTEAVCHAYVLQAKGSSLKAATHQKEATNAAAQASAIEATAAARAFAAQAAQSANAADKPAAADIQQGSTAAAAAADEEHAIDSKTSDFLPALPSITEIRAAAAAAWFGDSPYITSPTAAADHKDTQSSAAAAAAAPLPAVAEGADSEESEGLFDKLLPFGKDCSLRLKTADLVPGFRPRRHKPKPKPLRLKLAEQVRNSEAALPHHFATAAAVAYVSLEAALPHEIAAAAVLGF
jgi:hypothetical protein